MGQYVDRSLSLNEYIIVKSKLHWAMFITPMLMLVVGYNAAVSGVWPVTVFSVVFALWRLAVYLTTEMALTNKRVIAKQGVIRRDVMDVSLSKVEGVNYQQGILGRVFDYGSVIVRGTGVTYVPIKFIADPEQFKNKINSILHD